MKYVSFFLLISLSCVFTVGVLPIENSFKKEYFKRKLVRGTPSETVSRIVDENSGLNKIQDDSVPQVKIFLSEERDSVDWGSQIRYTINVSDIKDGDSQYGEINGNEVLLKIEYLSVDNEEDIRERIEALKKEPEHKGLTLMKKSTCFGCHADKTKIGGPSFSEMAEKYKPTLSNIKSLAVNISEGSSGIWGSSTMPAHPNFTAKETEQIADYILQQGSKKNKWIIPGLEGIFLTKEKPSNSAKGVYVLTASYTSRSQLKGQDLKVIKIQ